MAAMASRGFDVTGYDSHAAKVDAYRRGELIYEPGLSELYKEHQRLLHFSSDLSDIAGTDISFVVVPTPSLKNGAFSIAYLKKALKDIGRVIAKKNAFHLI